VPLISKEMLQVNSSFASTTAHIWSNAWRTLSVFFKVPKIITEYMKLVNNIIEYYPEKLMYLPQDLFLSLMKSIEFGLDNPSFDVVALALETIKELGDFYLKSNTDDSSNPAVVPLAGPLDECLRHLLQFALFKDFDSDLIETAGHTFCSLLRSRKDSFSALAIQIIKDYREQLNGVDGAEAKVQQTSLAFQTLLATDILAKTKIDRRDLSEFTRIFSKFLMEVRGAVRRL
jgi:hypothetical protein